MQAETHSINQTTSNGRKLSAAVIGTGKISEEHLKHLQNSSMARLAAVCDLSPSLAAYSARRFGAERHYTNYNDMLRELHPDVVHVLTPAHTHISVAADCLRSGAHVIVEKPAALNLRELAELNDIANTCERRLVEDHNYRFNRPVLAIEKAVEDGVIGQIYEVDVRMALNIRGAGGRYADANLPSPSHRLPAGVIHEFLPHLAYLALRFLPRIDRVKAAWSNIGGGEIFKYDDLDAIVIAGPVHARLRFSCHTQPDQFMVTVRGAKGWAEADLFQPYIRIVKSNPSSKLNPLVNHFSNGWTLMKAALVGFKDKVLQNTPYEGLHAFLSMTYESLLQGSEPPVSYKQMQECCGLIESLLEEGNRL